MKYETVSDMYPQRWVHPSDLQGKSWQVEILGVDFVEVHPTRTPDTIIKAALRIRGTTRRILINKTMANAIALITGSDRFTDWEGKHVRITPATTKNGKHTIHFSEP